MPKQQDPTSDLQHPHKSWACNPNTAKEDIIDNVLELSSQQIYPKWHTPDSVKEKQMNGQIDTDRQR